eukprot:11177831-Lingulodinium_polyedra.AAC.1
MARASEPLRQRSSDLTASPRSVSRTPRYDAVESIYECCAMTQLNRRFVVATAHEPHARALR